MIKQVCFNTLKNDIFGSTIINYTSLTVNHRKQRRIRSCLQAIKPRLNRWIWGKNKCILSRVHKTWSFYNIYFSINLLMGKPKVCCRQRETGTFFWQGLVTPLTAQFLRHRFGGLIFGGAYTWRGLFSEFYGIYSVWKKFFLNFSLKLFKSLGCPVKITQAGQWERTQYWLLNKI